jgi:hypothetical protein
LLQLRTEQSVFQPVIQNKTELQFHLVSEATGKTQVNRELRRLVLAAQNCIMKSFNATSLCRKPLRWNKTVDVEQDQNAASTDIELRQSKRANSFKCHNETPKPCRVCLKLNEMLHLKYTLPSALGSPNTNRHWGPSSFQIGEHPDSLDGSEWVSWRWQFSSF